MTKTMYSDYKGKWEIKINDLDFGVCEIKLSKIRENKKWYQSKYEYSQYFGIDSALLANKIYFQNKIYSLIDNYYAIKELDDNISNFFKKTIDNLEDI